MSAAADTHQNLIGGQGCAARSGNHFSVPTDAGLRPWPRSDRADVQLALASLRSGAEAWGALDPDVRLGPLNRAWAALLANPDPGAALASRLGLSCAEGGQLLVDGAACGTLDRKSLASRFKEGEAPPLGSVVLIRLHWSELLKDLFLCVAGELLAGRGVLLVSDGHVPQLAQGLADVLIGAGLPLDAWALLHDDGQSVLRAARADPGVAGFVLSAFGSIDPQDTRAPGRGFGDGVVHGAAPAWNQRPLVPRTLRVQADEDPRVAARRVACDLFGRLPSLSGQLPGMPAIVELAPRVLSAFTSELLLILENPEEGRALGIGLPCPWVDGGLATHLEQTLADGIDGGATLIHEERRPSFSGDPTSGTITRLVFTNVEREMRLLEYTCPAPVLLLRRQDPESTPIQAPS
jgi:hypothetical protein